MYDLKSIGSPRARELHQEIIAGTIYNMWPEIVVARKWKLIGEATVTDDPNDNYPDIIIKDPHKRLVFSLEITRSWGLSYDRRKGHMLKQRFPEAEFFIYNYETDVLWGLGEDGLWYSSREYEISSRFFERPLLEYIYLPEED
ncbi:MAG: hypothetical protein SPK90_04890 [Bacteroidales bacterium]|jgi:hypothetical protein|nr:hypothetical protein [Bacteroidales bacterium]MDY6405551.1 hypothetical protein [Bacteroidales bacterium]